MDPEIAESGRPSCPVAFQPRILGVGLLWGNQVKSGLILKLMRAPSNRRSKWPLTLCRHSRPNLKATSWRFTTLAITVDFPRKCSTPTTGRNVSLAPECRSILRTWRNSWPAFPGPREKTCGAKCGLPRSPGGSNPQHLSFSGPDLPSVSYHRGAQPHGVWRAQPFVF